MLTNIKGATPLLLLAAGEAADTAAATGTAIDVSEYEGPITVIQQVTSVGTNIAGKLQTGAASNGSDAADITGATFTTATEAAIQAITIDASQCGKYLRYVGTITGAACVLGVVALAKNKYV